MNRVRTHWLQWPQRHRYISCKMVFYQARWSRLVNILLSFKKRKLMWNRRLFQYKSFKLKWIRVGFIYLSIYSFAFIFSLLLFFFFAWLEIKSLSWKKSFPATTASNLINFFLKNRLSLEITHLWRNFLSPFFLLTVLPLVKALLPSLIQD